MECERYLRIMVTVNQIGDPEGWSLLEMRGLIRRARKNLLSQILPHVMKVGPMSHKFIQEFVVVCKYSNNRICRNRSGLEGAGTYGINFPNYTLIHSRLCN